MDVVKFSFLRDTCAHGEGKADIEAAPKGTHGTDLPVASGSRLMRLH
jgi:hypothetical protein